MFGQVRQAAYRSGSIRPGTVVVAELRERLERDERSRRSQLIFGEPTWNSVPNGSVMSTSRP
jgi:hypothetical protein